MIGSARIRYQIEIAVFTWGGGIAGNEYWAEASHWARVPVSARQIERLAGLESKLANGLR